MAAAPPLRPVPGSCLLLRRWQSPTTSEHRCGSAFMATPPGVAPRLASPALAGALTMVADGSGSHLPPPPQPGGGNEPRSAVGGLKHLPPRLAFPPLPSRRALLSLADARGVPRGGRPPLTAAGPGVGVSLPRLAAACSRCDPSPEVSCPLPACRPLLPGAFSQRWPGPRTLPLTPQPSPRVSRVPQRSGGGGCRGTGRGREPLEGAGEAVAGWARAPPPPPQSFMVSPASLILPRSPRSRELQVPACCVEVVKASRPRPSRLIPRRSFGLCQLSGKR